MMSVERLALQVGQRVLKSVPNGINLAFSYGSGVFKQQGQTGVGNVIDYIFVVNKPYEWHKENVSRNGRHYSFLKYFGAKTISDFQERFGAGVYFNTLIRFDEHLIKYGVISRERMITDLLDWDTLYLSGRLHKPVVIITDGKDEALRSALQQNLRSAAHTALLLLPEQFTHRELYTTLTSLSYRGDFRMLAGEDKNKVENIVKPNIEHFHTLYSPILSHIQHIQINTDEDGSSYIQQDTSGKARLHQLNLLPKTLQQELVIELNKNGRSRDVEDVLRSVAFDSDCSELVNVALSRIVARSSVRQSVKGVMTAGLLKTIKYSWKKMGKMMSSYGNKKR